MPDNPKTSGRNWLAKAGAWSAADAVGRSGLQFVVSMILARLLTPEDFGAVAIAASLTAIAAGILQSGFNTAVIRGTLITDQDLSAVFWLNLLSAIAVAMLIVLAGPALATFFSLPSLTTLVWVAALQLVVSAAGNIQQSLLNRDMAFRAVALSGLVATSLSGVTAILLAWQGTGLWALVAQMISSAALYSAFAWLFCKWRPHFTLRLAEWRRVMSGVGWISASSGLDVIYNQSYAALLGRLYGAREVGLFSRASATQALPTTMLATVISRVTLPVLSRCHDEPAVLRRHMGRAITFSMLLSLPALVGLSLTADLLIIIIFGPQWQEAARPLAILCLAAAFYPVQLINVQLILALDQSRLFFRQEVAKKVVAFTSVVVGAWWGMSGLAWGQVVAALLAVFINTRATGRLVHYGFGKQARDLSAVLLATGLMAAAVIALRRALDLHPFWELAAVSASGAAIFALSCRLLRVSATDEIAQFLPSWIKHGQAAQR